MFIMIAFIWHEFLKSRRLQGDAICRVPVRTLDKQQLASGAGNASRFRIIDIRAALMTWCSAWRRYVGGGTCLSLTTLLDKLSPYSQAVRRPAVVPTVWGLGRAREVRPHRRGAVSECVGLTSHSTHNRSIRRWVFPGNQLHWYWHPKTIKRNTTYTRNTKEKQKKLP